jgi:thiol-disulfide isomerase/thioredoxin
MKKSAIIVGVILVVAFGVLLINRDNSLESGPTTLPSGHRGESTVNVTNGSGNNEEVLPNFSLERLTGGQITLADYRGKKPVILDFWASWCPNCRRDMPALSRFYEQYQDRVEVIGINLQESKKTVERYITSAEISFPIALDPAGTASRSYGVRYTNTHVLVNKDGTLFQIIPGDISEASVKALIESNQEKDSGESII